MNNRLMITAATAALIAGTGLANAQGNMGHEGGAAGGSAVQQSAPSSPGAGAAGREGAGMKASQSEEKGAMKNERAQQEVKPGAAMGAKSAGEKSAQETSTGDKSKSMSSQNEKGTPSKDMKAEEHERNGKMKAEGEERNGNMKADGQERNGNMKAEGREESRSQTTGQAGAGAKLSTEQRTRITTVIRGEHVAPVNNVNFAISVGTRVPREIGFHPLPTEIVTIYPEWRGYEFFLVRDQIVVVDPRTLDIVAVLDA
ncbi:DUF1236 domain-containing protein [Bradyrhizobium sp.]|uniref:DUF1236 domain-containing protein n=1 Tax=Bradyrhizobium sp. TaxID=376 RepID=UPI003C687A06